jgi:hypothetical protein
VFFSLPYFFFLNQTHHKSLFKPHFFHAKFEKIYSPPFRSYLPRPTNQHAGSHKSLDGSGMVVVHFYVIFSFSLDVNI